MSDESYAIRTVNAEDASMLCQIIRCAYKDVAQRFGLNLVNCPKHPSNCTQDWVEDDLARGVTYYILKTFDRAVGCAALEVVDETLCYFERVAVLPDFRRRGLGRKLVRHILEEALSHGMKKVSIGIIAQQQELMQWYQSVGFDKGEIKILYLLSFFVFTKTNNRKEGLENRYHHILFVLFPRQVFWEDHDCGSPGD
jgi:N-acetylglutamate synthase-like GNAT family acetyltransferase